MHRIDRAYFANINSVGSRKTGERKIGIGLVTNTKGSRRYQSGEIPGKGFSGWREAEGGERGTAQQAGGEESFASLGCELVHLGGGSHGYEWLMMNSW